MNTARVTLRMLCLLSVAAVSLVIAAPVPDVNMKMTGRSDHPFSNWGVDVSGVANIGSITKSTNDNARRAEIEKIESGKDGLSVRGTGGGHGTRSFRRFHEPHVEPVPHVGHRP